MSHMLREEWERRGIWTTQEPHWDPAQAALLLQTHQGWVRWGQSSPIPEESTVEKVLTFTSKQHLLTSLAGKYKQVAEKLLNLPGSWGYLGWIQKVGQRTRQHYPSALYCVKTRNKRSLGKPSSKRTCNHQHTRDRTSICCRVATLENPTQHPLHHCHSSHLKSHFNQLCCCSQDLQVLLGDVFCGLLAAHHKVAPVDRADWAFPSTSSVGTVLWEKNARGQDPNLVYPHAKTLAATFRWEHLFFSKFAPFGPTYPPLRETHRVQALHSIISSTQDFSLSHSPRTHASGTHMPIWSPLSGLQPKNQL